MPPGEARPAHRPAQPNRAAGAAGTHHHRGGEQRRPAVGAVIDIDDFKAINDIHGHAGGDAVLVALAHRLRARMRPQDTAARLGGDEFALLCPGTDTVAAADLVASLTAALGAPVDVDGAPVTITVSIGAATSAAGGPVDTLTLLRDADTAMYATKRRTPPRA